MAIASAKRVEAMPGVPTVAESGVPGFDVTNIFGVLAPVGTPAAVIKRLNTELREIFQMSDLKTKLVEQGLETAGSTPEEWRASMQKDIARWARVVKEARITPE